MFFTTYMQRQDPYSNRLLFEVYDSNKELVSEAVKNENGATCLRYEGNVYAFPFTVKRIETAAFEFEHPVPSRKSSKLGYQIKKNDDVVAEYYGETAIVEKRTLFSRKMGFEVYRYNGEIYYVVKVGLPEWLSHFYCLIDAEAKRTVGVVERLQANPENARTRILLQDPAYTELALLVMASTTIMNVTSNAEGQIIDPSAGKYISLCKEERRFLDEGFIREALRLV